MNKKVSKLCSFEHLLWKYPVKSATFLKVLEYSNRISITILLSALHDKITLYNKNLFAIGLLWHCEYCYVLHWIEKQICISGKWKDCIVKRCLFVYCFSTKYILGESQKSFCRILISVLSMRQNESTYSKVTLTSAEYQ